MRKPASVLPDPVGAATSVCSPAAIGGQAASCAGVGPSGNRSRNQAATAGCSSTEGRSVVSTVTPPSSRGSNSDSCVGTDTGSPYVRGVTPRIARRVGGARRWLSRKIHRPLDPRRGGLEAEHHGHPIDRDRLPGRRRRRHGHGVHGRPRRSRGRPRHARRPSPRSRRALARRVSLRPAPPGVGVLRRRVDRARARHDPGVRPGGGSPGTGPSTGDPGVLRRHPASPLPRVGPRHVPRGQRVPRRRLVPPRDVAGLGRDPGGRRAAPGRRRHLPRPDHPRDDPSAVRGRRRRPGRRHQRARPAGPRRRAPT